MIVYNSKYNKSVTCRTAQRSGRAGDWRGGGRTAWTGRSCGRKDIVTLLDVNGACSEVLKHLPMALLSALLTVT